MRTIRYRQGFARQGRSRPSQERHPARVDTPQDDDKRPPPGGGGGAGPHANTARMSSVVSPGEINLQTIFSISGISQLGRESAATDHSTIRAARFLVQRLIAARLRALESGITLRRPESCSPRTAQVQAEGTHRAMSQQTHCSHDRLDWDNLAADALEALPACCRRVRNATTRSNWQASSVAPPMHAAWCSPSAAGRGSRCGLKTASPSASRAARCSDSPDNRPTSQSHRSRPR